MTMLAAAVVQLVVAALACGTVMNIDHVQRQRNEHSHAIAQSASMVVMPGTGSDRGGDS